MDNSEDFIKWQEKMQNDFLEKFRLEAIEQNRQENDNNLNNLSSESEGACAQVEMAEQVKFSEFELEKKKQEEFESEMKKNKKKQQKKMEQQLKLQNEITKHELEQQEKLKQIQLRELEIMKQEQLHQQRLEQIKAREQTEMKAGQAAQGKEDLKLNLMEDETRLLLKKLEQLKLMGKDFKAPNKKQSTNRQGPVSLMDADLDAPLQAAGGGGGGAIPQKGKRKQKQQPLIVLEDNPEEEEEKLDQEIVNLKKIIEDLRNEKKQQQGPGKKGQNEGAGKSKGRDSSVNRQTLDNKFQYFEKQSKKLQADMNNRKFKYMTALDKNSAQTSKFANKPTNKAQQGKQKKQENQDFKSKNKKKGGKNQNQKQFNKNAEAEDSSNDSDTGSVASSSSMDRRGANKKFHQKPAETPKNYEVIQIHDNETGYDYETLFRKFLGPMITAVCIEDPFIHKSHQIINFLKFCELLVKTCRNLQVISLVTTLAPMKKGTELTEQHTKLNSIKESLVNHKIRLNFTFSKTLHDREIRFNTGWTVKIGRGLDMYKFTENPFTIGYCDFKLRPCHQTTVNIYHSENINIWAT